MEQRPGHILLLFLLGLATIPAWTQQAVPSDAANGPAQFATPASLKTADGVASCPADPLPDGVLRIDRVDRLGEGVIPPKATYWREAEFSDAARKYGRKHHIDRFLSELSLTVDERGMPRDVCVVREAGHGLDRKAYEAVSRYRFNPATRDGEPVPARIHVEVSFKLY